MPRSHPPYEFKAEAVKLYRTSGKSLQEVAADLGMTANSLRNRLQSFKQKTDEGKLHDG